MYGWVPPIRARSGSACLAAGHHRAARFGQKPLFAGMFVREMPVAKFAPATPFAGAHGGEADVTVACQAQGIFGQDGQPATLGSGWTQHAELCFLGRRHGPRNAPQRGLSRLLRE
jgi:hypothetical protein